MAISSPAEREAVWLCLISGLARALRESVAMSSLEVNVAKEVYRSAMLHIADLDPPGVPLERQAEIISQSIDVFSEIYAGVLEVNNMNHSITTKEKTISHKEA